MCEWNATFDLQGVIMGHHDDNSESPDASRASSSNSQLPSRKSMPLECYHPPCEHKTHPDSRYALGSFADIGPGVLFVWNEHAIQTVVDALNKDPPLEFSPIFMTKPGNMTLMSSQSDIIDQLVSVVDGRTWNVFLAPNTLPQALNVFAVLFRIEVDSHLQLTVGKFLQG